MSKIREILDPDHTLPSVTLELVDNNVYRFFMRDRMNIVTENNVVGTLDLVSQTDVERFAHFDGINIDKKVRGRGVGLAAYVLAIELSHERNFHFQTQEYNQTVHAKKIWEHLANRGVAEIIEPFRSDPLFEDRYIGKYRVPIPSDQHLLE